MHCPQAAGEEFDWFACDQLGFVAMFSSGGSGQAPPIAASLVDQIEALQRAIGVDYQTLDGNRTATAGFYHYDVNINGGPFRRIGKPRRPRTLDDLPDSQRALVSRIVVQGEFRRLRRIPTDLVRY